MTYSIALFRDDFSDGVIAPIWAGGYHSGSATIAETGGQLVATLPSSTPGVHTAGYQTPASWDLTGDGCTITIGTMVATGGAAAATFQVIVDGANLVQWYQQSNTINAQRVVAGVATILYSAAWNATTYKYLRIRESGGSLFFDSSTNGTAWTNRASVANPFAITAVAINIGVSCGNIAAPGSFRVDDFNLLLPAPSSTWRETTADWSISNRLRPITLAATNNAQGVIVTADTMDASRVLGGTLRYFAGPLGSSSGGYLALTEYASLALAQASAFPIPVDGRVDLPVMIDARFVRLYHRSTDGSAHTIREFVPRRIVQADDIEAESIRAINIAAGAITADKISVINLAAVSAQMGALHMDGVIDIAAAGGIYQGSGSFASPTTGLKLFNSGGVGKLSTYNAGVEQVTFDTDGKLKAGAGAIVLSAAGASMKAETVNIYNPASAYTWYQADGITPVGVLWGSTDAAKNTLWLVANKTVATNQGGLMTLAAESVSGTDDALITLSGARTGFPSSIILGATGGQITLNTPTTKVLGGLNVGTAATGAPAGQIATSGNVGFGTTPNGAIRAFAHGADSTSGNYALYADNSANTVLFYVRNDGAIALGTALAPIGFYGSGGATKPTVSGSRGANAALASVLTALANLGLIVNSST